MTGIPDLCSESASGQAHNESAQAENDSRQHRQIQSDLLRHSGGKHGPSLVWIRETSCKVVNLNGRCNTHASRVSFQQQEIGASGVYSQRSRPQQAHYFDFHTCRDGESQDDRTEGECKRGICYGVEDRDRIPYNAFQASVGRVVLWSCRSALQGKREHTEYRPACDASIESPVNDFCVLAPRVFSNKPSLKMHYRELRKRHW